MIRKFFLDKLENYVSKWLILSIDVFLVLCSFLGVYLFTHPVVLNFTALLLHLLLIGVYSFISFIIVGSYKGVIRYSGVRDASTVMIATTILTGLLSVTIVLNKSLHFFNWFHIPNPIVFTHYLVTTFVLISSRFLFKVIYKVLFNSQKVGHPVLIYGAGVSGMIAFGAISRDIHNNYKVVGFIDDNKSKIGKEIDRVKVYELDAITNHFIEKNLIGTVIVAIQGISQKKLVTLTDKFIALDVQVKIVPPFDHWIGGNLKAKQIRQIKIEDLLNRTPININNPIVQGEVSGKVLMVTGAAGSIGSEISRQLSLYDCKSLILIDKAESDLYDLEQELIQKGVTNFDAILADIGDHVTMSQIFLKYEPHHIFHAAAYKHVPLMEKYPHEAVKVNVVGTKNIADLSVKYGVERFVMISSDKAVNPTNVMGASKRIAELYINGLGKTSSTKFTTTRFGNVLGSNGSVVPLFKRQIAAGGPITVTHKEITRYFMTIPEACSLVLEAGTMGNGGEIYIFDMGESIKIYNIAKRMIYLSGLRYPEEIDIKITGLRPGEKLYEELLADGENTTKTHHQRIMIAKTQQIEYAMVTKKIDEMSANFKQMNNSELVKSMKEVVPEYMSNNSEFELLDKVN